MAIAAWLRRAFDPRSIAHLVLCGGMLFSGPAAFGGKGAVHLDTKTLVGSLPIRTWKELRDEGIEKQDLDISCGAAATATILRSFYGSDVSEKAVIFESLKADIEKTAFSEDIKSIILELLQTSIETTTSFADVLVNLEKAIRLERVQVELPTFEAIEAEFKRVGIDGRASFASLKQAVKGFGFDAVGLTANFEHLKRLKIPVLVFLRDKGRGHFSVVRGVHPSGWVWLGDPLTGNQKLRGSRFRTLWESGAGTGRLLVFLPTRGLAHTRTHGEFYRSPTLSNLPLQHLMWQPERLREKAGIRN